MASSSSSSPCAACKFLRRKCTQECVFAPYFPPDQQQKFSDVHKIFGASNVAKILNDINSADREDAVKSLAYEAEYRLRDPVYGCVSVISYLHQKLKAIQYDLFYAQKELANYIGPCAMMPFSHQQLVPYGSSSIGSSHPDQILETPQHFSFMIASSREQDLLSPQPHGDLVKFNGVTGYEMIATSGANGGELLPVSPTPSMTMVSPFNHSFQMQEHQREQNFLYRAADAEERNTDQPNS